MAQEFDGRVALVTGAASGIGAAIAERLASSGAKLVIGDIDQDGLEQLAARLRSTYSATVVTTMLDVSDPDASRHAVELAKDQFGLLHLAVNNAGISGPNPVDIVDHELADFRHVMSVNVEGVFLGMKYQIPAILSSGGGAIVNIASVMGCVGSTGIGPYVASKHAVVGLTRAAALENATKAIRINAVGPGFIKTPILDHYDDEKLDEVGRAHPIGRLGTAMEIAETVVFLLSDRASFTTAAYYAVDGGYTAQ
jgi:NAD(P)-dependent dehydrogenase (short-subunit alcohol dehydrogenase family)